MRIAALILALIAALAGCGGIDQGVRDEGGIGAGDRPVVSPPAAAGEVGARPEVPAPPGIALVYFLRYEQPSPTRRRVGDGLSELETALRDLVAGPTAAERSLRYRTAIPVGTTLLDVTVANRVAIVDLSAMPRPSDADGSEALLALYQVVFTATAPSGIEAVRVLVDGSPYGLGSIVGEDNPQEAPLTRSDLAFVGTSSTLPGAVGCSIAEPGAEFDPDVVPEVRLGAPAEGGVVERQLRVRGRIVGRPGSIVIRVIQDDLEVLSRVIDDDCLGRFAAAIPLPRGLEGEAVVDVYVPDDEGAVLAGVRRSIVVTG